MICVVVGVNIVSFFIVKGFVFFHITPWDFFLFGLLCHSNMSGSDSRGVCVVGGGGGGGGVRGYFFCSSQRSK